MPIYEYRCDDCGAEFEKRVAKNDVRKKKPKPKPTPQPQPEVNPPFRQDLVLLEGAKSAIAVKDWAKARSLLHDCLVIAPKQSECARLLQTLP